MHLAGLDYAAERANALSVDSWRPLFERCRAGADDVVPGLGAEVSETLDRMEAAWPRDLPRGVIHADLFPDNVFFDRERLSGLIDFYFRLQRRAGLRPRRLPSTPGASSPTSASTSPRHAT